MDFISSLLYPDQTSADVSKYTTGRGYAAPSAGSDLGIYANQASEEERQNGLNGSATGLGHLVRLLTYLHQRNKAPAQESFAPPTMDPSFQNDRQYQDTRAPFLKDHSAGPSNFQSYQAPGQPYYQHPDQNKQQLADMKRSHALQLALLAMRSHSDYRGV